MTMKLMLGKTGGNVNLKAFSLSTQGATHIKNEKECQDYSKMYEDDNIKIITVCDGHGGSDYVRSAIGARFAGDIVVDYIKEFLENTDIETLQEDYFIELKLLEEKIISSWKNEVRKHYEENDFTELELSNVSENAKVDFFENDRVEIAYGTTLIAVGVTEKYWIGIHIGDGKCVAINPEGKFLQPIPWDSKCFLNATTSMCDINALDNFREFFSEKLPVAVFLGTDGIDDSFENSEMLYRFYKTILYSFANSEYDIEFEELKDYLPRLSEQGSGDDISLSAIFDLDTIGEIEEVRNFGLEIEQAIKNKNEQENEQI